MTHDIGLRNIRRTVLMDRPALRLTYERRNSDPPMGRFGGGWQWKVGFQAGGRTLIVNLLVSSLRFDFR